MSSFASGVGGHRSPVGALRLNLHRPPHSCFLSLASPSQLPFRRSCCPQPTPTPAIHPFFSLRLSFDCSGDVAQNLTPTPHPTPYIRDAMRPTPHIGHESTTWSISLQSPQRHLPASLWYGFVQFPTFALPVLIKPSGYGWPFSAVLVSTSLLVIYAAATFAMTLFMGLKLGRLSTKLGDFCLAHLQVTPQLDCPAPFPHTTNIPFIVDATNTRPPPVFSFQGLASTPIQLLAPVDLPNAILNKSKSCFLFKGEKGYLHVRAEGPASNFTGISFDYSLLQRQLNPVYTPREVALWGLYKGSSSSAEIQEHLRSLSVDTAIRQGPRNTSYILIARAFLNPMRGGCMPIEFTESLRSVSFEAFVIQTLSNWGGDHTCLAPFRFHVRGVEDHSWNEGRYFPLSRPKVVVNFAGHAVGKRIPSRALQISKRLGCEGFIKGCRFSWFAFATWMSRRSEHHLYHQPPTSCFIFFPFPPLIPYYFPFSTHPRRPRPSLSFTTLLTSVGGIPGVLCI
jgi:hypothetical protein